MYGFLLQHSLCVCSIIIAKTILSYQATGNTNRSYLAKVIETHTIDKTASELVATWKKSQQTNDIENVDWQELEKQLKKCLIHEANNYLESDDSYLQKRANKFTPTILAERFLKNCDAIE